MRKWRREAGESFSFPWSCFVLGRTGMRTITGTKNENDFAKAKRTVLRKKPVLWKWQRASLPGSRWIWFRPA
jgi:hypothetical protein